MFLHELLHFQFIHYWDKEPNSAVSKLSDERYELLKESLTVVLDNDFIPLIKEPDKGYVLHKEFRQELYNYWIKTKNFDKLVKFGLERLPAFCKK